MRSKIPKNKTENKTDFLIARGYKMKYHPGSYRT